MGGLEHPAVRDGAAAVFLWAIAPQAVPLLLSLEAVPVPPQTALANFSFLSFLILSMEIIRRRNNSNFENILKSYVHLPFLSAGDCSLLVLLRPRLLLVCTVLRQGHLSTPGNPQHPTAAPCLTVQRRMQNAKRPLGVHGGSRPLQKVVDRRLVAGHKGSEVKEQNRKREGGTDRVKVKDEEEEEVAEDDADSRHGPDQGAVAPCGIWKVDGKAQAAKDGLVPARIDACRNVNDKLHDLELSEVFFPPHVDLECGQHKVLQGFRSRGFGVITEQCKDLCSSV